ncbi:MAG: RDD family protein [Gammaproteobacteria bacterium]
MASTPPGLPVIATENDKLLDTRLTLETPEGIELVLAPAGPVVRGLAWSVDAAIRVAVYIALGIVLSGLGKVGLGLWFLLSFLVGWFYPVVFEVYSDGSTPGKKAFGLRVLHDDGTPVGWQASLVRNFIRTVDAMPIAYGFGLATMLVTDRFKRLGDLTAGTMVVYRERQPRPAPAARQPDDRQLLAVPPPVALLPAEQQLLLDYADRVPRINPERALELAELCPSLAGGQQAADRRLLGIASYIAGERA